MEDNIGDVGPTGALVERSTKRLLDSYFSSTSLDIRIQKFQDFAHLLNILSFVRCLYCPCGPSMVSFENIELRGIGLNYEKQKQNDQSVKDNWEAIDVAPSFVSRKYLLRFRIFR